MLTQTPQRLTVIEKGPNQSLLEYLRAMLARAETGEVQGIAAVFEWNDGSVGEGWCVTGLQRYRTLGGLQVLTHKLAAME